MGNPARVRANKRDKIKAFFNCPSPTDPPSTARPTLLAYEVLGLIPLQVSDERPLHWQQLRIPALTSCFQSDTRHSTSIVASLCACHFPSSLTWYPTQARYFTLRGRRDGRDHSFFAFLLGTLNPFGLYYPNVLFFNLVFLFPLFYFLRGEHNKITKLSWCFPSPELPCLRSHCKGISEGRSTSSLDLLQCHL